MSNEPEKPEIDKVGRRSFLTYSTIGMGAVTAGLGVWGLGRSLAPDASVTFERRVDIDLSGLGLGEQWTVVHERKPIFVTRLTDQQIIASRQASPRELPDPHARNPNLPAKAEASFANRSAEAQGVFVVVEGRCPRRGCVPLFAAGDFGGWFCPCGGAHFDNLGRIRKGPLTKNLLIPSYVVSSHAILTLFPAKSGPNKNEIDTLLFGGTG